MDLKLGVRLFDVDAQEAKRARMQKTAETTTSGSMGARITGMSVYHPAEQSFKAYSKSYGKELTQDNILSGFLNYFLLDETDTSGQPSLTPSQKRFIIRQFISDLEELQDMMKEQDGLRLWGSSLLLIYEGDPEAFGRGWDYLKKRQRGEYNSEDETGSSEGEEDGDEEEPALVELEGGVTGIVGLEDQLSALTIEDKNLDATPKSPMPKPHRQKLADLRMIDFAHSHWFTEAEYSGPDEGHLQGIESAIMLLKQCLEHANKLKASSS